MVAPSRRSGNTVISTPPLGAGGKPLRDAAETIASKARQISGQWSDRIPASVKVTVSADGNTATVTAGGDQAPAAYTMEGRSNGAPISHPVFGNRSVWVKQFPTRPFLQQAADAVVDQAADKWGREIIDAWSRSAGFR